MTIVVVMGTGMFMVKVPIIIMIGVMVEVVDRVPVKVRLTIRVSVGFF